MTKIGIATIFYNNYAELDRLIKSIPNKVVDTWICVDGPFRYNLDKYPDLSLKSNDGSLELINDSASKFIDNIKILYRGGASEFDKRNAYLETCDKYRQRNLDVLLIIDSDEYSIYPPDRKPERCWDILKQDLELEKIKNTNERHNVYGIRWIEAGDVDTYKPRIWFYPYEMRYINGSHYHYANTYREKDTIDQFRKQRLSYQQPALKIFKYGGVALTQDNKLRTDEYLKRRDEYQKYLNRYEELIQSFAVDLDTAHKMAKETATNNN